MSLHRTHHPALWTVTENVSQGARICAEFPLIHLPSNSSHEDILAAVNSLTVPRWSAYMALGANVTHDDEERAMHDHSHNWPLLNAYQQEVLAIRQHCQKDRGICAQSGAVEISYMPNCAGNYNAAIGLFPINALKDFPAGTMLSMSYGNLDLMSVDDQLGLIDGHMGGCTCSDCARSDAESFWGTKRMCVGLERLLREKVNREGEDARWDAFSFGLIEKMVGLLMGMGMSHELAGG
jgi:hypothetical protein